ncbi:MULTISPECIES: peptide-methionine (S)-S-oxide reductase MsrA [Leuconostoc]|uniref:Peptide methionine sulfoxide reductase MsrA n=2 Tax=Leuconostoc kimchii TaxID=136609 RepID=D5T583_LEUKI|nr:MULTISPECIES: peptide-methionine (S)-S-oxide reductase MsrA [Leuconostoc]ADG41568.1 protein-methionine-S-oxide reductase [Leuconostoc kimchii IMSNU 11154]AEJ30517.1 protein-methionine-S-oxide reductase [Leuconostoc sp. C2]QBR47571.1 peptide-methionine (S)-S-oxide reductase [Leuconostoc kimchii]
MHLNDNEIQRDIYNLILNPSTREWERESLLKVKDRRADVNFSTQLDDIKSDLRPLALRHNLTPDVMDFYLKISGEPQPDSSDKVRLHDEADPPHQERAIFAGGCFWCMVSPFDKRPGITAVISGYTGGEFDNPNYDQVVGQYTGHVEAVEILFDKRLITYQELVDIYWQLIDPTDNMGQIDDRGESYRPVIFVNNDEQRQIAEQSRQAVIDSEIYSKPIVVEISDVTRFWPAENFHQDFYKKNTSRYRKIERTRRLYLSLQHSKNMMRKLFKKVKG